VTSSFYSAIAVSLLFGAPVSGLLMSLRDLAGLRAWQIIFIAEGLPSVVLGIVCLFYLHDRPSQASWLSEPEATALQSAIIQESEGLSTHGPSSLLAVAKDYRAWLLGLVIFGLSYGIYAVTIWLPQILQQTFADRLCPPYDSYRDETKNLKYVGASLPHSLAAPGFQPLLTFEHGPQRTPHNGDAIDQATDIDLDHLHRVGCHIVERDRVERDNTILALGDPGADRRIDDGLHRLDHTPDVCLADEGVVEDRAAQNNFLADMLEGSVRIIAAHRLDKLHEVGLIHEIISICQAFD